MPAGNLKDSDDQRADTFWNLLQMCWTQIVSVVMAERE